LCWIVVHEAAVSNFGFTILPFAVDVALTIAIYLGLDLLFRRRRPVSVAIIASFFVPLLLAALGMLFWFVPNPDHGDGPGMGIAACVMSEIFAIPTSVAAGAVVFFLMQRRRIKEMA